ncbi:DOMON domain-containing protein FRRS1L-like [Amphiura filiformis]|uniref:DOMON domain-containing protein FRRS1L-like n=1 Tax=Amphiura filiformis TaxID=82378 RepID=UPI003B21BCCF
MGCCWFSLDGHMGDDDILMCRQTDAGPVVLEHYWSILTSGRLSIVDETSANSVNDGLSNIATMFENGIIDCTFTRAISVLGKAHIYDLSEQTTADMLPKYRFFFGTGPVIRDVAMRHEVDPYHTDAGVNFTLPGDVMVEKPHDSHEGDASYIKYSLMLLLIMTCLAVAFN